jgi:predicted transcriptional regulator
MLRQITTATTSIQKHDAKPKYRCKVDVIAVILEIAASGEVPKSKIYYNLFLTYQRLRGYMTLLIEAGLIEYSDYKDKRAYKTTDKGILFLQDYNGIRDLIG